ncbi:hypothetical protein BLNAU_8441 [Blattamonas nauphoetae]|uniref:Uncharacterized protein n=1 Tax=Blattamonas nauphoetae TaxID=2049346 RepID=A0ABQ9XYR7_9EUKA|nr:hypothetical protein BLNAU_8441 [Blattamonas nauphoetae]
MEDLLSRNQNELYYSYSANTTPKHISPAVSPPPPSLTFEDHVKQLEQEKRHRMLEKRRAHDLKLKERQVQLQEKKHTEFLHFMTDIQDEAKVLIPEVTSVVQKSERKSRQHQIDQFNRWNTSVYSPIQTTILQEVYHNPQSQSQSDNPILSRPKRRSQSENSRPIKFVKYRLPPIDSDPFTIQEHTDAKEREEMNQILKRVAIIPKTSIALSPPTVRHSPQRHNQTAQSVDYRGRTPPGLRHSFVVAPPVPTPRRVSPNKHAYFHPSAQMK